MQLIRRLIEYYESEVNAGRLLPPGWDADSKISFQVRIDEDGNLLDIVDIRDEIPGKKTAQRVPRKMAVPSKGTRTGTSAKPAFVSDPAPFLLGCSDRNSETGLCVSDYSLKRFNASKELHDKLLDGVDSVAAKAILRFFDSWDPAESLNNPIVQRSAKLLSASNGIFHIETVDENGCIGGVYATDDIKIKEAWNTYYAETVNSDEGAVYMPSLVSGATVKVARVHNKISAYPGGQVQASLISFNKSAFNHFCYEQGLNAPMSNYEMFAYTSAFNKLKADPNHSRVIGGDVITCWAENSDNGTLKTAMAMLGLTTDSENTDEDAIARTMDALSQGKKGYLLDSEVVPDRKVYVCISSAHGGRSYPKAFYDGTLGDLAKNVTNFAEDFHIEGDGGKQFSHWRIVKEALADSAGDKLNEILRERLLDAALFGYPYPRQLLECVLSRIMADTKATKDQDMIRAATIKAYYRRERNMIKDTKVLGEVLNEESTSLPYVLGRLFAEFENVQWQANRGTVNSSVKDRYFRLAMTRPAEAYAELAQLSIVHLKKIKNEATRISCDKHITELMSKITEPIPTVMRKTEDRSQWFLGYYHERRSHFDRAERSGEAETAEDHDAA